MKFRYDINALRALAVILVVLYHFDIPGFKFGYVGVDIFFVVSGFLMTKIIAEGISTSSFSFPVFMYKRAKRILPALITTVLGTTVIAWLLLLPSEFKTFAAHAITSTLFFSNEYYALSFGYFDAAPHTKWLLHTWSLSVEWQFYLFLPVLLLFFKSAKKSSVLLAIFFVTMISFGFSLFYNQTSNPRLYFGLETRAWELLFGSLAYYTSAPYTLKQIRRFRFLLLLTLLLALPTITLIDGWPNPLALVPVATTGMLIAIKFDYQFFRSRGIFFLGLWSYSIYLWHWPVFALYRYFGALDSIDKVLGILISCILGAISYELVEKRLTNIALSSKRNSLNSIKILFAGGLTTSFLLLVFFSNGAEFRYSKKALAALSAIDDTNKHFEKCTKKLTSLEHSCIYEGETPTITAIVYGDSHASALASSVHSVNRVRGSTLVLSLPGCPLLRNIKIKGSSQPNQCDDWNINVINTIKNSFSSVPIIVSNRISVYIHNQTDNSRKTSDGPLVLLDGISFDESSSLFIENFYDNLFRNIEDLSKTNPVYYVLPIPEFPYSVPKKLALILSSSEKPVEDLRISVDSYKTRNAEFFAAQSKHSFSENVVFLDPRSLLCNKSFCDGTRQGVPLYSDSDHLTESTNKLIAPLFHKLLTNAD